MSSAFAVAIGALLLAACAGQDVPRVEAGSRTPLTREDLQWLDRITWGVDAASARELASLGRDRYLERQLRAAADAGSPAGAPFAVGPDSDASTRAVRLLALVQAHDAQRHAGDAAGDDEQKKLGRRRYQQALTRVANESAGRSLLRDIRSPSQLQEQMTWFWLNHFSVFRNKANLRLLVGDFEESAIRPHALGRFRDLLLATMRHPAMLRYLDNERNAVGRINENYARELMELHTLGVDGGYTQRDVQELARVLTGLGINATDRTPRVRPAVAAQYVRDGLFEFNPNRHDYGDKMLLGRTVQGRGLPEIEAVADLLSRQPATARHVSRQLAIYFVADDPPATLVDRMAATFTATDGDIAATLRTLLRSSELSASLGHKFKDPLHYVVSAVRSAYDGVPVTNAAPVARWLDRLGEPPFGRLTPDGYPLTQPAWSSAGQLGTRFEIARIIGSGSTGLFPSPDDGAHDASPPRLASSSYYMSVAQTLAPATRQALDGARSVQEWNLFLLASPEFMLH